MRKILTPKEADEFKKILITVPEKAPEEIPVERVISTGSTLLDLTIAGKRIRGGGIPPGILVEIFGPSGWGKTSLLGEICASAQARGGYALVGDGERRMDLNFMKLMGVRLTEDNLRQPHTVRDLEEMIFNTPETGNGIIDITGMDSVTSLLSSLDEKHKEDKKGDKRGSTKAKELHQLCRRAKAELAKRNRLVVFTNQIQDNQDAMPFAPKERVPGGNAIPFYSSLRMRIGPSKDSKLTRTKKVGKIEIDNIFGIRSHVNIIKNSIDENYRNTDILIVYNYGIDDIRANLEYIKRMTGSSSYWCVDTEMETLDDAISHIEKNKFQKDLKEQTINMWEEIQAMFKVDRITKLRT